MCLNPIVVRYSNSKTFASGCKSVLVQCGKCHECIKTYQNDWMVRNYFQFLDTKVAVFFTLTYGESNVPCNFDSDSGKVYRTVCKDDVQLFLKRFREFRRKRGLSTDFKYFITSEYGPTTLRPHYHGLLHSLTDKDCREFFADWRKRYGFVQFRTVSAYDSRNALNSARYVAKYCSKGSYENPFVDMGLVDPTFHLISKGLGKNYLTPQKYAYHLCKDFLSSRKYRCDGKLTDDYLEEVRKRLVVSIPPCSYHMPRFYREAIFKKSIRLQMQYSDYVCQCLLDNAQAKLVELSSDVPVGDVSHEAYALLHLQTLSEEVQRGLDSREHITKFFKQSKI